eukprot:TRINITY_DN3769_c0_g1_i8.p1 TRINITY_DN3769_c0_g1~~TRINITY_DN3769_c0_g1_i8.p1  ORF type:complete len:684 (-),score=91.29 TRINITY_DN3769_c0_g1_i8:948-2999(-)
MKEITLGYLSLSFVEIVDKLRKCGLTSAAAHALASLPKGPSMSVPHGTLRQLLSPHIPPGSQPVKEPFQFEKFVGRNDVVRQYCRDVLIPRFKMWRNGTGNKSVLAAVYLFGPSGTGKSRTSRDLVVASRDWLDCYVSEGKVDMDWLAKEPRHMQLARDLLQLLGGGTQPPNWTVVFVDLFCNGVRVKDLELSRRPSDVILGMRVAAKYFGVDVAATQSLLDQHPALQERFELDRVVHAIAVEGDQSRPRVLHLVFDEIQNFAAKPIRYEGGGSVTKTEPAANAFVRSALDVCNTPLRGLFVVGSFAGTATVAPPPVTALKFTSYLLGPLSVDNMMDIVEDEFVEKKSVDKTASKVLPISEAVFKLPWFRAVIRSLGGLPRLLEYIPDLRHFFREQVDQMDAVEAFARAYAAQYFPERNMAFATRGLAPFVALSGVPVTSDALLSPKGAKPLTARLLEEAGVVTRVRPPEDDLRREDEPLRQDKWVARWGAEDDVVLDMPLVLVLASIKNMSVSETVTPDLLSQSLKLCKALAVFSGAERFEEIAVLHRSVRSLTASTLAVMHGQAHVSAKQLYCGTDCSDAFVQRQFAPTTARQWLAPAAGVWAQVGKKTGLLESKDELHVLHIRGQGVGSTEDAFDSRVINLLNYIVDSRNTRGYSVRVGNSNCAKRGGRNIHLRRKMTCY